MGRAAERAYHALAVDVATRAKDARTVMVEIARALEGRNASFAKFRKHFDRVSDRVGESASPIAGAAKACPKTAALAALADPDALSAGAAMIAHAISRGQRAGAADRVYEPEAVLTLVWLEDLARCAAERSS